MERQYTILDWLAAYHAAGWLCPGDVAMALFEFHLYGFDLTRPFMPAASLPPGIIRDGASWRKTSRRRP